MLSSKRDLQQLQDDSADIYMSTRFDRYLHCPDHLRDITYPEFFKWWQKTTSDENSNGGVQSGSIPHLQCRATNDFAVYISSVDQN